MEITREIRDRRIAVARDVLAMIADPDEPLRLRPGSYFDDGDGSARQWLPKDGELRDHADRVRAECTVCNLGALLLAKARLYDAVPLAPLWGPTILGRRGMNPLNPRRSTIVELLADTFGPHETDKIESAFECRTCGFPDTTREFLDLMAAAVFGMGYGRAADRCAAVMGNIVANDGVFTVAEVTLAEYNRRFQEFRDDEDEEDEES